MKEKSTTHDHVYTYIYICIYIYIYVFMFYNVCFESCCFHVSSCRFLGQRLHVCRWHGTSSGCVGSLEAFLMNGRASKEKRSTARNEVVGQSMGCEHEQPCIPSDLEWWTLQQRWKLHFTDFVDALWSGCLTLRVETPKEINALLEKYQTGRLDSVLE